MIGWRCRLARVMVVVIGLLADCDHVQLLDLMGRQRRDVVPKCARHSQSELMFCETCDVVFCVDCAGASHAGASWVSTAAAAAGTPGPTQSPAAGATASAHTVIPFSIAIKRMSEILLYKVFLSLFFVLSCELFGVVLTVQFLMNIYQTFNECPFKSNNNFL